MSEEVFEMICAMDRRNIELQIVLQCAPTIAGLKTSNLLIVPKEDEDKVRIVLRHSGLFNYRLVYDGNRVIFLVFNRDLLSSYLDRDEVQLYLRSTGYTECSFGYVLRTFQSRYNSYIAKRIDFPHEMGLLLGYPVADVRGFIDNKGNNFLYSGYWKVYSDAINKKALFERFDYEKDQMLLKLSAGYNVRELIYYYKSMLSMEKAV